LFIVNDVVIVCEQTLNEHVFLSCVNVGMSVTFGNKQAAEGRVGGDMPLLVD